MNRARFLLGSLLALSLGLAACSKTEPEAAAAPKRTPSVEIVSAEAKGFTAGAMMNANAVYVFFDAQCPHCSRLWEASVPLHKKAKFVWIPVGLLNALREKLTDCRGLGLLAEPAVTEFALTLGAAKQKPKKGKAAASVAGAEQEEEQG